MKPVRSPAIADSFPVGLTKLLLSTRIRPVSVVGSGWEFKALAEFATRTSPALMAGASRSSRRSSDGRRHGRRGWKFLGRRAFQFLGIRCVSFLGSGACDRAEGGRHCGAQT